MCGENAFRIYEKCTPKILRVWLKGKVQICMCIYTYKGYNIKHVKYFLSGVAAVGNSMCLLTFV